jgi:nucleotide-binding universal stress UspA family protein
MLTVRSILCPVDLSEQSGRALTWASAIAQHRGATLTVLYVGDPMLAQAAVIRLGVDVTRTEARSALRAFVHAALSEETRKRINVRTEVSTGDPSEVILRLARRRKAGLIVMGTHGLGGFRRFLIGSTTEQVLRRTRWPVLAVPASAESAPTSGVAAIRLKQILLATDFREGATAALQWASDLAFEMSARVVLAHVVEPVVVPLRWQGLAAEFEGDRIASSQQKLARVAGRLGQTRSQCVVSIGPPADTIAALASEHSAGLVVMGLTRPADSVLRASGAIAYRVLRKAHVPVLVVPGWTVSRQPPESSHQHAPAVDPTVAPQTR